LLQQNVADRKGQLLAHKAAMDAVCIELEKAKDEELEAMRSQCLADLGEPCLHVLLMH